MTDSISIIIVAYNSEEFIDRCISSILKYLPNGGEVTVVDNASEDDTLKILKKYSSQIKIINSDKNLGFAKANNLAVKSASSEFLFFLNPDTYLNMRIFEPLISFFNDTDDAGIVVPKLVMPNGQIQPSVKNLPTVWGAIKEYLLGIKNSYSEYIPESERPSEVGMVYGAAMLIRRELFRKVGGFDEKYFMYYEDADLCQKVRSLEKKIYYYPAVFVNHIVGGVKTDLDRYKLNYDSFVKYHGLLQMAILQLIFQIPRIKRKLFG